MPRKKKTQTCKQVGPRLLNSCLQAEDTCLMAALATVSGKSLDNILRLADGAEVVEFCKTEGLLKKLGLEFKPLRDIKGSDDLPNFGIVMLSMRDGVRPKYLTEIAHAVCVLDGLVYDPNIAYPLPVRVYTKYILEPACPHVYTKGKIENLRFIACYEITSPPPKTLSPEEFWERF